jgi:hypothetical protein
MHFKILLAILSIVMTLVGYSFYFRDIFKHKTKPHAFSWLVWATLTGIAFAGQITNGAGAGAWVTLVTAIVSCVIFFLALKQGEKNITLSDKLNLASAALVLLFWFFTNNPLTAIILVTIIDFLGSIPTIRKSYLKPYEETLIHYVLAGLKFVLAIMALQKYSLITCLYPASLVASNLLFAAMLVIRRRTLDNKSSS